MPLARRSIPLLAAVMLGSLVTASLSQGSGGEAASGRQILFILDASGSMSAKLPGGGTRMEAAQAARCLTLREQPEGWILMDLFTGPMLAVQSLLSGRRSTHVAGAGARVRVNQPQALRLSNDTPDGGQGPISRCGRVAVSQGGA